MTTTHQTVCAPSLVVHRNRLCAILRLPACSPVVLATPEALSKLVEDHGLTLTDEMEALLKEVAARFATYRQDINEIVAEGVAPKPGRDGDIEWVPQYSPDHVARPEAPNGEAINFYEVSAFQFVEADVHVATLLPPRPGKAGVDVFGQPIASEAGKPFPLVCDNSINVLPDGRVMTAKAGIIEHRDQHHLRVSPILRIPGHVDFSTGNVRFDGTVQVGGDVRDQFEVDCTGDVQIGGSIEAAHIRCGGTLRAAGGMAGKDTGRVEVGSHMWARYLDGVRGTVRGRLCVTREILMSQLIVLGDVQLIGGAGSGNAIIGGLLCAAGAVTVQSVGSPAGITTHLRLGFVPEVGKKLDELRETLRKIDADLKYLHHQHDEASDDDDIHFLAGRIANLEARRRESAMEYAGLSREFEKRCFVKLSVTGAIHPGVFITMPQLRLEVLRTMNGPLRLMRMPDGRPRLENGRGEEMNFAEYCRIVETESL